MTTLPTTTPKLISTNHTRFIDKSRLKTSSPDHGNCISVVAASRGHGRDRCTANQGNYVSVGRRRSCTTTRCNLLIVTHQGASLGCGVAIVLTGNSIRRSEGTATGSISRGIHIQYKPI